LFSKYGKLPTHKNVLMKMQKACALIVARVYQALIFCIMIKDRKYFDSGDYALSKAGRAPPTTVGTAIPNPEK
jgi:hypothetical protein